MGNLLRETPYSEITATLEELACHGVTREHLTRLRSDTDYAKRVVECMFEVESSIADWREFYREFGITCDFSSLVIPKHCKGFDRLIVVAQGPTIEQVFQQCQERFPCRKYAKRNLDKAVSTNDRDPQNGPYAVWVRDRVEADKEHKNHSAYHLEQKHIPSITLLERFLFELKYFMETGKHLDIKSVTLCSGSRYIDGHVPHVCWRADKFCVDWYCPRRAYGDQRAREVVAI